MDLPMEPWTQGMVLFIAGFLLARTIYRRTPAITAAPRLPQDILDEDIDAEIRAKRTIEAIKLYRQRSACGLKEARQAIETRARQLDIQH